MSRNSDAAFLQCSEVETMLLEKGWQTLNKEEKTAIEKHVLDCPHCRRLLSMIRNFEFSLAQNYRSSLTPNPKIRKNLIKRMKKKKSEKMIYRTVQWFIDILNYRIPAYQAAIAILLILISILFLQKEQKINHNEILLTQTKEIREMILPDQMSIVAVEDIVESQKVGTTAQDDSVLLSFFVSSM